MISFGRQFCQKWKWRNHLSAKKFCFQIACISNPGLVRRRNEDNFACKNQFLPEEHKEGFLAGEYLDKNDKAAVFDGVGGGADGEIASYLAAKTFADYPPAEHWDRDLIQMLFETLHSAIRREKEEGCYASFGTTATAFFLDEDAVWIANSGDSPGFLYRNGTLSLFSKSHTDAELIIALGADRKPTLTQYLGMGDDMFPVRIAPAIRKIRLCAGDRILLCTDGLTDMVSRDEIARVLQRCSSAEEAVIHLKKKALEMGGLDNFTVLLCDVREPETHA